MVLVPEPANYTPDETLSLFQSRPGNRDFRLREIPSLGLTKAAYTYLARDGFNLYPSLARY